MNEPGDAPTSGLVCADPSVELSSNRTSLSFERTWMSADRTLMATIRTSLSLISFGFTLNQVFSRVPQLAHASGRRLGLAMLALGVAMLAMGILGHARFGRELARRREHLFGLQLLRRVLPYRLTPTYVVAVLLLLIGIFAIADAAFQLAG